MQQNKVLINIVLVIFLSANEAKIMRNNALITKMVSNFHQNNDDSTNKDFESVLVRMQIVLCKNFPTIPCELITQDQTLKRLIEESIQQINYKKLSLNKTTALPGFQSIFPPLNNEELSNFIQLSDHINRHTNKNKQKKKLTREGNQKLNARTRKTKTREGHKKIIKNKGKATSLYNRKKMRKYYPHKVKYADKNNQIVKEEYANNDAEFSMSQEVPDAPVMRKHFTYKVVPSNPPVWRIDYSKHGETSVNNLFDYDLADKFNRKIMKSGGDAVNEQTENDALHRETFAKSNYVQYVRQTNDVSSDDVD